MSHTSELVLSLFPGIDILGRGFEDEGFCVVRGPDLLWGGDIRNFHTPPGKFEASSPGHPARILALPAGHPPPVTGWKC